VLRKQHRRIHRLARELRDEGGFSPKQRRILRRKLDKASDLIWTLKHNEDYRYARRHEWRQDRWDWDDDSSSWQSEPGSWLYFGFTGW
jgi:hypothetical protein